MSYSRYPKYKESGVEWLGAVPEHWTLVNLGKRYKIELGKMLDEKKITGDSLAPYLRNTDVQWGEINTDDLPSMDFDLDSERFLLKKGDLLVCEGGEIGRAAIWSGELERCYYQKALHRVRPLNPSIDIPKFLFYLLLKSSKSGRFNAESGKSTIAHLPAESFRKYVFCFPSSTEQEEIAAFLDHETSRIDALIGEQERLLKLLEEKRQAVITEAVCRGLRRDAVMKHSGVEWLGAVPEHWEIKQLKHLSRVARGASPRPIDDPIYFDDDGEFAWVRISDVTASNVFLTETTQNLSKIGASFSVKLNPGNLFISIAGTVGKPCIAKIKCCIHDGFVYFPDFTGNEMYIYRIFESERCYGGLGKFGTQLNLNTNTIGSIKVPVPPLAEQEEIVAYLERETERIDALRGEVERGVELLRERRGAVISEAVTGKIDVRGWRDKGVALG